MRAQRVWVALAASGVVLIAGWFALAPMRARDSVAAELSGRTWLAIDQPNPVMPWLRFTGDGDRLEIDGTDGCNRLGGFVVLDGSTIANGQVESTLMICGTEDALAGLYTGSTVAVRGDELVVADPGGRSTRYLATDALGELTADDLVGTYTAGLTPVSIDATTISGAGCARTWSLDGGRVVLTGPTCPPGSVDAGLLAAPAWDAVTGDAERVVVEVGGVHIRLDRAPSDAPDRPGVASFLGAVAGRTWVLDAAAPTWPAGRVPSVMIAPDTTLDGAARIAGHDGCSEYVLTGRWVAAGGGWALAHDGPVPTDPACAVDGRRVVPATGRAITLGPDGSLTITAPDGTDHRFVDARAATIANGMQGPIADLPGRWELDPGTFVDITAATPDGVGAITLGGCAVPWWGTGNEWIGAGPVPARCADGATGAAAALFRLLDTGPDPALVPGPVAAPVTVGASADRSRIYLASADGTVVLRLTRPG